MENNMTQGKEWKAILLFSLPVAGSYLLQILYNISDSIIVGNFVGPDALGAVGLTSAMSANLAVALAKLGYKVGLLDADIFGPSMPKMFQVEDARPYAERILR